MEGGFVQGLGLYTIEELHFFPDGTLLSRGPSQYKIPALCDVPAEFNVHLRADAENLHAIYMSKVSVAQSGGLPGHPVSCGSPLCSQGVGEPPVFFAIKSAIAAARLDKGLSAVFPLSSPATAQRIRMA